MCINRPEKDTLWANSIDKRLVKVFKLSKYLDTLMFGLIWFDFCFTALRHILGHFGRGQLT